MRNGGYTQTYSRINTESAERLGVCGKLNKEMAMLIFEVGERMMSLAGGCQSDKGMKRGMPEEKNCCRRV